MKCNVPWFLKKWNIKLPYAVAIPLLNIYTQKNWIQVCKHRIVHNVHGSTIQKNQKAEATLEMTHHHLLNVVNCSMDKHIGYIHVMEYYYSAIKRNEELIHPTTQISFANSMLSKRSQMQKATHCTVPQEMSNPEQANPQR